MLFFSWISIRHFFMQGQLQSNEEFQRFEGTKRVRRSVHQTFYFETSQRLRQPKETTEQVNSDRESEDFVSCRGRGAECCCALRHSVVGLSLAQPVARQRWSCVVTRFVCAGEATRAAAAAADGGAARRGARLHAAPAKGLPRHHHALRHATGGRLQISVVSERTLCRMFATRMVSSMKPQ